MNQQDLTAPPDPVKISKREDFRRGYELYQDETTPQDLAGYTFFGVLTGPGFYKRTLSEGAEISRLNAYTVGITMTAAFMQSMVAGNYTLDLFGDLERIGEQWVQRDMIVQLQLQVVP